MDHTISVIIPNKTNTDNLKILQSLKDIDYPKDKIEIIIAVGNCPPIQRNHAAKVAKGDILYFTDSDSQLDPEIFKKVVEIINRDSQFAGVGGPDLTPENNSYIQHLFGYAMSSYFAHWRMRARYLRVGMERISDEKELILCNIAIRRDIFLKSNCFNEKLYPNEENELINRISKIGYKFVYNPDIITYRDRRKTLFEFAKQFYKYGQGRMSQIFIEGLEKNLAFFLPVLLLIYLVTLPFVKNNFIFVPLGLYMILGLMDALILSLKNKKNILILPIIYLIMHVSYGIGILRGAMQIIIATFYRKEVSDNKVIIKKKTLP